MSDALKVTGPAIVIRAGRFGFGYRIAVQLPEPPRGGGSLQKTRQLALAYNEQLSRLPVVEEDVHGKDGTSQVDVRKGPGARRTPRRKRGLWDPGRRAEGLSDWLGWRIDKIVQRMLEKAEGGAR